jgi:8-oxo-dGTP pyrophosphatase MutT (NUDIX family)
MREVKEETGFQVEINRLIGVYSEPGERIVTYPDNGDVVHLVDVVLGASIVSGELTCSDESEEVRFFEPDRLPDALVPPARQPLSDALQGLAAKVR